MIKNMAIKPLFIIEEYWLIESQTSNENGANANTFEMPHEFNAFY